MSSGRPSTSLDTQPDPAAELAVLVSGGVDSAVLLAEASRRHPAVWPLYVRFGLFWEEAEQAHLQRFLGSVASRTCRPLVVLEQPVRDLYAPQHWSVSGRGVPAAGTPDESVYLPGRNVLLLAKSMLWCHLNRVPALALAPLESNPFPDATPSFFTAYESAVNQAVQGRVRVHRPYIGLSKTEVLRRGAGLPLEWTFSCLRPSAAGWHCGACNKCEERRLAFRRAGIVDPTPYSS